MSRTAYRTCPLCEAACGLELTVSGDRVVSARGDREHVFSHGFVCPKGATFGQLADDPDRLRRPLVKRDGVHVEVDAGHGLHEGAGAELQDERDDDGHRDRAGQHPGEPLAHVVPPPS